MPSNPSSLHDKNIARPTPSAYYEAWLNHDYAAMLGLDTSAPRIQLDKIHEERVEEHSQAVEAEVGNSTKSAWTGPRLLGPGHPVVEKVEQYKVDVKPVKLTGAFAADLHDLKTFENKVEFGSPLLPEHLIQKSGNEDNPSRPPEPSKPEDKRADASEPVFHWRSTEGGWTRRPQPGKRKRAPIDAERST